MASRHVQGARAVAGGNCDIVTAAETNQLKTGRGVLRRIQVWDVGATATIDIYDHGSSTTNQIFKWVTADGKVNAELDIPFEVGLRVVTGGTFGGVNIVWAG